MNRDDIIRMAREAGIEVYTRMGQIRIGSAVSDCTFEVVRFAKLVAALERQQCAWIAKSYGGPEKPMMVGTYDSGWFNAAEAIAADIRARGEEPKRHPGYIIGGHWLQAAYTRICTGETEDEVMTDYGWQRARGEK